MKATRWQKPHERDYEYRGLLAKNWDLFRGDTSGWEDRVFFHELILQHGQPALDVGCGTGRLLLDFLAHGLYVDGVDISPEMIELCRQKAQALGLHPVIYQQAMESLDLPRRYRTIFVPSSSFQLLTDLEAAREAMRRLFAHLQAGGVLAMPFMLIWKEGEPVEHQDWKLTGEKVRLEDGALARRWSRARYDVENQLEHTEDRYEVSLNDEAIELEHHRRSPATRWYTQAQAVDLYQEAGFTDSQILSESTWQPASADEAIFTVIGRKP